jgi:hypothetical protein
MAITASKPRAKTAVNNDWKATLKSLEAAFETMPITEYQAAIWSEMYAMAAVTHGGALNITGQYPGGLRATLERLRGITENATQLELVRATILEKLPATYLEMQLAMELLGWDAIATMCELPEYAEQPLNVAAKQIALYPNSEHGHSMDRWSNLCLGLWYANFHLGINITSLEPASKQQALFDAPPTAQGYDPRV